MTVLSREVLKVYASLSSPELIRLSEAFENVMANGLFVDETTKCELPAFVALITQLNVAIDAVVDWLIVL